MPVLRLNAELRALVDESRKAYVDYKTTEQELIDKIVTLRRQGKLPQVIVGMKVMWSKDLHSPNPPVFEVVWVDKHNEVAVVHFEHPEDDRPEASYVLVPTRSLFAHTEPKP